MKLAEALFKGKEAAMRDVQNINPERGPLNFKITVNSEAWMEMLKNDPYLHMYIGDSKQLYGVNFEIVSRQKEKYLLSWDIGYELAYFIGAKRDYSKPIPLNEDSKLPRSKELTVEW